MSKNNGNGTIKTELILDLNSRFNEILENQAKTLGAIMNLQLEIKNGQKDMKNLDERFKKHLSDHQENPQELMLSPIIKKLGWKRSFKIIGGAALILLLLSFLLLFIVDKLGLSKTLGILK